VGGGIALRVRSGAAPVRSRASSGETTGSPSIDPWALEFADLEAPPGAPASFPEIDCLRGRLSPGLLAAAERRAGAVGVGADRVLIAAGALGEEAYLRAFGEHLGIAFEPLDDIARALCPVDDERLIESAAAGLLPLTFEDDLCLAVAPRGLAARRIVALIDDNPDLTRRFRFTSAERLNHFVLRCAGATLAAHASDGLKRTWPALSAAPPRWRGNIVPAAIAGLTSLAAFVLATAATLYAFEIMLAGMFLAWLGLRLVGAFIDWVWRDRAGDLADAELPVYTVIAALYREAGSVDGLLAAIERLDYPGIMAQTPQAVR
jgi:hypothetical protein